ncbi:hypothetical protein M0R45_007488 [Rubus argutus]|uniref:F-box domain-containing protein n=1 Tax=Rubus argutus TaxID=59490 RepID=A0AAW1XYW3_RUBAR
MELDRISGLPNDVSERILSCLPLREAVRTSVVSRKWRYKSDMLQDMCLMMGVSRRKVIQPIALRTLLIMYSYFILAPYTSSSFLSSAEMLGLRHCDGFTNLKIDAPNLRIIDIIGVFEDVKLENTSNLAQPHIQRLTINRNFLKYLSIGALPEKLPKHKFLWTLKRIMLLWENSPALERITIKPSVNCSSELVKELLRFRRLSMLAEIIYLDP